MQDTKGDTTLFLAIEKKNYFMLTHYLEQGKNPNARYNESETPLFYATTIKSIGKEIIQALLSHNADPNIPNSIGNTPLHNSITNRRLSIATILLDHGADPTFKNKFGYSPLDLAREDHLKRLIGPLAITSLIQAINSDNLEQAIQALKDGKSTFQQEDVNIAAQLALEQQKISILNKILSFYPCCDDATDSFLIDQQKESSIKCLFKKLKQLF